MPDRRTALHAATALGAYALIALWVTRPLAAHLLDHSLVAYPITAFDVPLNAWILSWVSRSLVTAPTRLFDANIYHPQPEALAYTEHMLGSVPFFGPTFLATGNPALALNVMILCGLVLTAFGTYWLTWRWTGSRTAAAFAGLVVGFHDNHVRALGPNLQTTQYLPFVLLFLDRVLAGGGARAAVGLTVAVAGQSLASYYYAYPTVLATGAALVAVHLLPSTRPRPRATLAVGAALGITACILAAVSVPYFRVAEGGTQTVFAVARLIDQVAPSRIGQLLQLGPDRLGWATVVLAAAGILAARAGITTRRRVLLLVVWVVVGYVLAAGSTLRVAGTDLPMPDRLLDRFGPGFAALRDRRRLFVVAPVALGVLAGLGIVAVAQWRGGRRLVPTLALATTIATALAMNLGPCRLLALPTGAQVPAVYRELARHEPGPVVEVPLGATLRDVVSASVNTRYEYFSIFHWRPLVNGYASYWPPQLEVTAALARGLPDARALANLAACTGVRWVIAHLDQLSSQTRAAFEAGPPGLRLAARFAGDALYEVDPLQPSAACVAELRRRDVSATIEGTPLAPLPPDARLAAVERVDPPSILKPRTVAAVPIRLRNTGPETWPAVALDDTQLVRVSYEWQDAAGAPLPVPWRHWTRLAADVRPGDTIDVPLAVQLPITPGDYRLGVVVRQGLQGTFALSGPAATAVPVTVR